MSVQHFEQDDYYNLGTYHRVITTSRKGASMWFSRGLIWCYGFNHEEAAKCFEKAVAVDNHCSMAYWGLAHSLGANYNKPWDLFIRKERQMVIQKAHNAIVWARAVAHSPGSKTTDLEKALIDAQLKRYPRERAPGLPECQTWNEDYADAMAEVYAQYPGDFDVATLYAEAMMNLTPWKLWDLRTGEPCPKARTLEIQRVLETGLASEGGMTHPGLLHLYIHLMENSSIPEAALPAANKLRMLVPDSGHLSHMPSHIDILIGDYHNAVVANSYAIIADDKFLQREGAMNFYTLYRCHDYHFRLYSAMFSGQSAVAMDTVVKLEATISEDILRVENPPMADWLESFLAMRVHALVRFGRWQEIIGLELPQDPDLYCVTTALTLYAKGVAYAASGDVEMANYYRDSFRASTPHVKPTRTLFNNKCVDILGVAEAMLDGEVEYRSGNYDAAFSHLRVSIAKYDNLPFDEPWGWMQPTRHAYGALLLEQGHVAQALKVYSADLGIDDTLPRQQRHPKNVWSLHGYHECLVKLGRKEEAIEIRPDLDQALAVADVPIKASCFCRKSAATAKM